MDDADPASDPDRETTGSGTDAGGDGTGVAWRPWGEAALADARAADRPVLLSLVTPWCAECRQMDAESYADPGVIDRVAEGFVPVRADADRHPRLRERYAMGGFPSTVLLTPGGELLAGATAVEPDGLRQVLDRVGETYAERGDDAGRVPRALRAGDPPAGDPAAVAPAVAEAIENQYDAAYAGWGTDAKFPLPQAITFALKRDRSRALSTLDAVLGGLHDDDGGFFRYAAARDWTDPRRAKLLDANAALVRALAHAYCYTGGERFREAAEEAVDYLAGTLWTGRGFGASQAPPGLDAAPAVPDRDASAPADTAAAGAAPPVDPTVLADRNAVAADALCHLAAYTDDARVRRYAERTLDAVADLVDDGTVAHYDDAPPEERGGLADQAAAARAFATAASVFGPDAGPGDGYLALARGVADAALDDLRVGTSCVDGPRTGAGLLDRPLRPVGGNAVLADALVDLAALADVPDHRETATDLVAAFAGAADRFGPELAGYARAADRANSAPLEIAVAAPAGDDLHRAALRVADHEKVVVPDADAPDAGTTVVSGPGGEARAATPDDILAAVGDVV